MKLHRDGAGLKSVRKLERDASRVVERHRMRMNEKIMRMDYAKYTRSKSENKLKVDIYDK